jgi:FkbH-like protein
MSIGNPSNELITIAITATFTAEPLERPLIFWMQELGIRARVEFAPYNQVLQQLLDPSSLLTANRNGINVVLVRLEDWQGINAEAKTTLTYYQEIERNARDLVAALTTATDQSAASFLVFLCPASPSCAADVERASLYHQVKTQLSSQLAKINGIYFVATEELEATYPVAEYDDPQADRLAHIPYRPVFYTALGTLIARKIYTLKNIPYKAIVLDCDQTLWNGICGEDGPLGIRIGPARKFLQEFMVRQHDRGRLLCLCSKNNEEDVTAVFEHHRKMVLKRRHIASSRINWSAKSENLRSLARQLNLGLDSFIFVDDDPVECAEVKSNCPEVLTLELPREPDAIPKFLEHVWAFDHLKITDEDRKRTALYQQNAQREQFRNDSLTFKDFLAGLGLKIEISSLSAEQLARASDLTRRTNQLNLTSIRRSEAELRAICQPGGMECLAVHARDRFGDYGLAGLIVFEAGAEAVTVDTFLLSCRAMGRGVEHRMVAHLGEVAKKRGLEVVELVFVPSGKNEPARQFLVALGMEFKESCSSGFPLRIPAEIAANLEFSAPIIERSNASPSDESAVRTASPFSTRDAQAKASLLSSIAVELHEAGQIHKIILTQPVKPLTRTDFIPPQTPLEEQVAAVWSEVLGFQQIDTADDFFALGGHSLLAMQVLSRMSEMFRIELSPTLLFSGEFTVAALARTVSKEQICQAELQDITALLRKVEELSDDEVKGLLADRDGPKDKRNRSD